MTHALGLVGVRELFVRDDDIAGVEPELGQVGVRVDLGRDEAAGADDGANARDEVALEVVVAVGDGRAVQAEHHGVQRQRRGDLGQDDAAEVLVDVLVDLVRGVAEGGEALNEREAMLRRPPPQHGKACAEQRGLLGVRARREVYALLEGGPIGRDRGEGVGLGAERRREHAARRQLHGEEGEPRLDAPPAAGRDGRLYRQSVT